MEYYIVTAKCGHVGRYHYVPIEFAVKANSKKEASDLVRTFPRVKRDHDDCILDNIEVSEESYFETLHNNDLDPYLHVTSKQEQDCIPGFNERIVYDEARVERDSFKSNSKRKSVSRRRKLQSLMELDSITQILNYEDEFFEDEDYMGNNN